MGRCYITQGIQPTLCDQPEWWDSVGREAQQEGACCMAVVWPEPTLYCKANTFQLKVTINMLVFRKGIWNFKHLYCTPDT